MQREQSQLLIDLFETLFLILRQVGTVIGKRLVSLGHEAHLLGIETELVALVIDKLHPFEQSLIEDDTVAQVAQHRAHLLGNGIHLIVTVCFLHIKEHTRYAV